MKRQGVASLKKKADKFFSLYVRYRDSDQDGLVQCITCSVRKPVKEMQAGHFVSRTKGVLRYDEQNVNGQCVGCNMFKQGEQFIYGKNIDKKYGDGTAEALMARRFESHKFTVPELEEIIEKSKEYIKDYEG